MTYILSASTHHPDGAAIGFVMPYEATDPYAGALALLASLPDHAWPFVGDAVTIRGSWSEQRLVYEESWGLMMLVREDGVVMARLDLYPQDPQDV